MNINTTDFQKKFPLLAHGISTEDLTPLLTALTSQSIDADEHLITYGETHDALYLLCSGKLSVVIDVDGKKIHLGNVLPGGWVGEITLIEPGVATASVMVTEPGTVLSLTRAALDELQNAHPVTASALLQGLSLEMVERLRAASTHLLKQVSDDEYDLQPIPENPENWFTRLSHKLLGLKAVDQ